MMSQRARSDKTRPKSQFTFRLPSMWIVVLVSAVLIAPGAFAQTKVDFTCNQSVATLCAGAVVQSGSNYSTGTSGISVFNDGGPFGSTIPFTLSFNTATDTISLDGTGVDAGMNLVGTIVSFTHVGLGEGAAVVLEANWFTLPPAVQAQLGSSSATDTGSIIYMTATGNAQSVDILFTPKVSPVPEPASMLLMGSGLLAIGGLLRKRLAKA